MSERFERTGEFRRPQDGEWYESDDASRPLCAKDYPPHRSRWILRRVDDERTIPTRYVYAGEGQPLPFDPGEPERKADAIETIADLEGEVIGALRSREWTNATYDELLGPIFARFRPCDRVDEPEPERKAEPEYRTAEGCIDALDKHGLVRGDHNRAVARIILSRYRPCDRDAVIEECARRLEATNEPGKVQCQLYASSAAAIVRELKGGAK